MAQMQLVILGASGDLTARKLVPAMAANLAAGALPASVQIIGVSRSARSDEAFRDSLTSWIPDGLQAAWEALRPNVFYESADTANPEHVARLKARLDALTPDAPEKTGRLFYLALKPDLFASSVAHLDAAGLLGCDAYDEVGWRRVVVEKPFGRDLASARELNHRLLSHVREDQLFRIDHYLGKETVQNILAFRFQNAIFEPLWNRDHVESVEITVAESIGVEGNRGAYYDTAGALRDMVQNHLLQVLALVAMEPPNRLVADAVRNEKVKVLQALRKMRPENVAEDVVRGQYVPGPSRDRGYLQEPGVDPESRTETYVAIRASIDNWRWNGVPFFLRTGKALNSRYTEIVMRFRAPPVDLLGEPALGEVCSLRPNALTLMLQPKEGFRLSFLVKEPGSADIMRPAELGFDYDQLYKDGSAPKSDAYQRLLLDALNGNATLFIRGDETEAAWEFADAIRAGWEHDDEPPIFDYPAGSYGPGQADELFRGCEGIWGRGEGHN